MTVKKIIVGFILLLACAGFIYGVWSAFSYSFCKGKDPAEMPDFPIQVVTVIGGVLATNLGAVLGIKIETAKKVGFKAKDFFSIQSNSTISALQIVAAFLYLLVLAGAVVGWGFLNFTEESTKVVGIIPQLSKTLLGVLAGVLAVALGGDS